MAKSLTQRSRSLPEPQGWILAIVSSCFLLAAGYFVLLSSTIMFHEYSSSSLIEELDKKRLGAARTYLERSIKAPPFANVLVFSQAKNKKTKHRQTSEALFDAYAYLTSDNIEGAFTRINSVPEADLVYALGRLRQEIELSMPKQLASKVEIEHQAIATARAEIGGLKESQERALIKHREISIRFADFFSLKTAYGNDIPSEPLIYKSGVLEGLPMLKGIKDNISDLKALQRELMYLGGRVRVSARTAHSEYNEKTLALRDESLSQIHEYNRLGKRIEEVKVKNEAIFTRYLSARTRLEETLKSLIGALAKESYARYLDPPFWLSSTIRS